MPDRRNDLAGGKAAAVVGDVRREEDVRGTFLLTQSCLPAPRNSANPHVLEEAGVDDLSRYGGGNDPRPNLFLDEG